MKEKRLLIAIAKQFSVYSLQLSSLSTSWGLEDNCYSDVIKEAVSYPIYTLVLALVAVGSTSGMGCRHHGHLQKNPRVGKGDSGQLFLPKQHHPSEL